MKIIARRSGNFGHFIFAVFLCGLSRLGQSTLSKVSRQTSPLCQKLRKAVCMHTFSPPYMLMPPLHMEDQRGHEHVARKRRRGRERTEKRRDKRRKRKWGTSEVSSRSKLGQRGKVDVTVSVFGAGMGRHRGSKAARTDTETG
jgi:hypothetical protein